MVAIPSDRPHDDRSRFDSAPEPRGLHELLHLALFYRDHDEYIDGVMRFIGPGIEAGEPVALAIPPEKAELLRDHLDSLPAEIELLDMFELGRNPARIIPAVQAMLEKHGGKRLHYVGEPIWPGRSAEEMREATRHEALINLAWPHTSLRVLCPYDASALDDAVLADAERTHPYVITGKDARSSGAYDPTVPLACDHPLPEPPDEAATLTFGLEDLGRVRGLVRAEADAAGLRAERASDLVLAINELATNTIRHAHAPGVLRVWSLADRLICQVDDSGHITDLLVGRWRPVTATDGGMGLWMVNQLCDLVEVRSAAAGTSIRVHTPLR